MNFHGYLGLGDDILPPRVGLFPSLERQGSTCGAELEKGEGQQEEEETGGVLFLHSLPPVPFQICGGYAVPGTDDVRPSLGGGGRLRLVLIFPSSRDPPPPV